MPERALPPGQRALGRAPPRFGLDAFLKRKVEVPAAWRLVVDGEVEQPLDLDLREVIGARRTERTRDLHCVTTWTATDLAWSGATFADVWREVIVPRARPKAGVKHVLAVALDGYQAALPLEELLAADVMLADTLHGEALTLDHGAPLRLVVPQLYGYKNVKHLVRLTLRSQPAQVPVSRLLAHPRGRVDLEERSGAGAQRFWRVLYRALVGSFLRRAEPHQMRR
jgi:DMSO/TMAO reductase YedYZ molybdopterin-dependent catalytic subunit